jgi:hypothetical protein
MVAWIDRAALLVVQTSEYVCCLRKKTRQTWRTTTWYSRQWIRSSRGVDLMQDHKLVWNKMTLALLAEGCQKTVPSPRVCYPSSKKVKLSLCLSNNTLCQEGVWGSGCIDPHFLDLDTSWRWVVRFTPRLLYPRGKSHRYPLDRRLSGA